MGLIVMTEPEMDKTVAISLCHTGAHMKAGETSDCYRKGIAKVVEVLAAPPVREAYEVKVQEQGSS